MCGVEGQCAVCGVQRELGGMGVGRCVAIPLLLAASSHFPAGV